MAPSPPVEPVDEQHSPRIGARLMARVVSARSDSLARNSFAIMATTVVTAALGALFWLIAARSYDARDIGLATALVSAMSTAALIADLGVRSALVQALPQRNPGRDWSLTVNAGFLVGASAGLGLGVLIAILLPTLSAHFAGLTHSPAGFILLVLGVVTTVVATAADYVCVAERQAWKMFARNLAFAIVRMPLLLALPVLLAGPRWEPLFGAWSIATVISCAVALLFLLPRLGRAYSPAIRGITRELRRFGMSLVGHHLINIGGALPMFALPLVVTGRLSASANAYFYVTWMLCSAFFLVSPAVAAALLAEGSHAAVEWRQTLSRSVKLTGGLLGPLMLIFVIAGHWILGLFGRRYAHEGFVLLLLLVISALPDAVTNIYITKLRIDGRLLTGARLNLAMGIGAMVLSWFLLPPLGIAGAGAAWLIAQLAGTLFCGVDAVLHRSAAAKTT